MNLYSDIDRRLVDETVLDFKEAGADLPEEKETVWKRFPANWPSSLRIFRKMCWMPRMPGTLRWRTKANSRDCRTPQSGGTTDRFGKVRRRGGANAWVFTLHTPSMLPVCNTPRMTGSVGNLVRQRPFVRRRTPPKRVVGGKHHSPASGKSRSAGKRGFCGCGVGQRPVMGSKADAFVTSYELMEKVHSSSTARIRNWRASKPKRPGSLPIYSSLGKSDIGRKNLKRKGTISITKTCVPISPFNPY